MKIYIDGIEVLCDKNIIITEEMLNTPSVILNNVYPKSWETTQDYTNNFYYPSDYSKCLIYDDNNNLLFCGVVENTGDISLNPREPHYCNLQVLDFKHFLSIGETLDYVLVGKTIEEAIEQIINTISGYGFIKGNINILNPNDIMGAYSTKDKTAYDVFNYIADITQSRWTTRMVDEDTVAIDFYDPTLMPQGTAIDYTKAWFELNNIINIDFNYSSRDYRNRQVMTSQQVFGSVPQTETISSDGYNVQYLTEQRIGTITNITVNGSTATFAKEKEKELGITADFYYTAGNNYFTGDSILSVGTQIRITYTPIIEGRQIISNVPEISKINHSTGRKGVVARYENRNDATTSNELQKIGQSYIKYKGVPEITLKIETLNNIWNVGERVSFNNSPMIKLQTEYMVKKKTIQRIATVDNIFYTYELTSSFNSESAINYFDNQRNKAYGNISEGQYINRNIDIEDSANVIFYDVSINEVQQNGDNILNCVLNSPFNN